MSTGKLIAYYRVSTERQGKSGLGLEAQQHAVHQFLAAGDWELSAEYVEIESGKKNDSGTPSPCVVSSCDRNRSGKDDTRIDTTLVDWLTSSLAVSPSDIDTRRPGCRRLGGRAPVRREDHGEKTGAGRVL